MAVTGKSGTDERCTAGERGGRHEETTVTFWPCDTVSVLGTLQKSVPADVLRIVALAVLSDTAQSGR